jgi:lipopolysaccharide/colanic/teichoic acid biosynthesis glycosyltransferase
MDGRDRDRRPTDPARRAVRGVALGHTRGGVGARRELRACQSPTVFPILYPRIKRGLDLIAAAAGGLVLLPLLAVITLLVRVLLGSPVLFRQVRPGLHGRPFELVKFRTMTDAVDAHGNPLDDTLRLTRFGRFLRSSSLDELPELWNVLRGDMSLVGPRPLLMEYLSLYTAEQARRHEVRPGITGLAQVSGRNALGWEDRFSLDVWYVDHHSFAVDAGILFRTLKKVFVREGISQDGHVTMSKFGGSSS